jgi:flagellin-like protein
MQSCFHRKAISPIIATLLLIVIAIAAGVVVYSYVIGFVGNSTINQGNTPDTLTIDQMYLSSSDSAIPVTAFVRNLGPSPETFATGFSIKSQSMNDVLGIGVRLVATQGDFNVSSLSLSASPGASSIIVNVIGGTCTGNGSLIATGLGNSTSAIATCSAGSYSPTDGTLGLPTGVVEDSESLTTSQASISPVVVGAGGTVFGLVISSGGLSVPINSVIPLTLAPQGVQTNSLLSAGYAYTLQIAGSDGAMVDFQSTSS